MKILPMDVVSNLKGFELKQAEELVSQFGWKIRTIREDGIAYVMTADFVNRRINVEVEKGIIINVFDIG